MLAKSIIPRILQFLLIILSMSTTITTAFLLPLTTLPSLIIPPLIIPLRTLTLTYHLTIITTTMTITIATTITSFLPTTTTTTPHPTSNPRSLTAEPFHRLTKNATEKTDGNIWKHRQSSTFLPLTSQTQNFHYYHADLTFAPHHKTLTGTKYGLT